MKTTIFSFLAFLFAITYVSAQTNEGSITYSATIDNTNAGGDAATNEQVKAMLQNMKLTMYFKGKNTRVNTDMGMMTNTTIKNGDKVTMLIDAMGMKYKLNPTADQMKQQKMSEKDYTITYTNDTKTIAGYECKKAIIKMKDGKTSDVYYTDKVFPEAAQNLPYTGFKGCPLQYVISKNGMSMTMTATEVSIKPVDDSIFNIPDGYSEMPESMKSQIFPSKK
jgi:GLPGLI family protein